MRRTIFLVFLVLGPELAASCGNETSPKDAGARDASGSEAGSSRGGGGRDSPEDGPAGDSSSSVGGGGLLSPDGSTRDSGKAGSSGGPAGGTGSAAGSSGGRAGAAGKNAAAGIGAAGSTPTEHPEGGGSTSGGAAGTGGSNSTPGSCDAGTSNTTWAANCPTVPPKTCVAGTWKPWGSTNSGDTLLYESEHFAVYSDGAIDAAQAKQAVSQLENVIWPAYFGSPMYLPEPYCDSPDKLKASIIVHADYGLSGGCNKGMGMWVGPGATSDHWGLAHEFMHAVQCTVGKGLDCSNGPNLCGWIYESHANFSPHQLAEYADDVHCTELSVNAPHLYLGSTRDRYCNWQFMEYLKDKYCYQAVNDIWTAPAKSNDPFDNIMATRGWTLSQLNDFFGDWAMHNVTWDYRASGAAMRSSYAGLTDKSKPERRLRLTALEPLDANYPTNRRFQSPYFWAPQRWGYNVVRLIPDSGSSSVTVTFRGVTQTGADSDWRWGIVATDAKMTTSRYSALQHGSDGELTFCTGGSESLWLVVVATPSVQKHIAWDQAYSSIYRYPYLVEFGSAWPDGFQGGTQAACASGLTRIANGGGCGPANLASTVYVGPYAQIVGGTVRGDARIEDHATVVSGTVSGGTVGALSIISGFGVSGSAKAQTTFYPLGFFESGQAISGSTVLYGDVEFRGQGYSRSSGSCSGFVDTSTCVEAATEVTVAPPYGWRP